MYMSFFMEGALSTTVENLCLLGREDMEEETVGADLVIKRSILKSSFMGCFWYHLLPRWRLIAESLGGGGNSVSPWWKGRSGWFIPSKPLARQRLSGLSWRCCSEIFGKKFGWTQLFRQQQLQCSGACWRHKNWNYIKRMLVRAVSCRFGMVGYLVCRTTRHVHPSCTPHRSSSLCMNQREAIPLSSLILGCRRGRTHPCWLCQPYQKAIESRCWKHPAVRHWAG